MSKINVKNTQISIILGCNGHKKNNILFCSSTEMELLRFNYFDNHRQALIKFLDKTCSLFSFEIKDYNKILNIISLLHKVYNVISSPELSDLEKYCKMHKDCGIFLYLKIIEE